MSKITKLITEQELRTFILCPQLYKFNGSFNFPVQIELLKLATEKAISESIRYNKLDPELHYMTCLLKASKELKLSSRFTEAEIQKIHSVVSGLLGELFSSFKANKYIPVFGPAPWRVKVSKTTVELIVSGILRHVDSQTLHAIDFSPYENALGMRNDPISYLKNSTFAQFVAPWHKNKRPECVLHLFSISQKNKLLYHQIDSRQVNTALLRTTELVRVLEAGYSFPSLPCERVCAFRSKCNIGES